MMATGMRVISLGWGVQSFTLAAMVALGELEPVDAAVHADTTHERSDTYAFAQRWTPWLGEHGVKVFTVRAKQRATSAVMDGEMIPAYTLHPTRKPGQARRSCTQRWKIAPMRRWMQANRGGEQVELWIGISLDEFWRMKDSDVSYVTNRHPLIERRMTRDDCEAWLIRHGIEVPPKSACVFCPFRATAAWRELQDTGNGDWSKALEVDRLIRNARTPTELYLHPSRKPLDELDLRTPQERGQLELWANWDAECSGVCGV